MMTQMPENAVEISLAGKYETRTATRGLRLKRAAERASSEEQTALTAEGTPAAVELPVVSEASSHRAAEAAGDADRPARDPEESTEAIRIPGYHIVGRLGRHGMGEVFRARDEQLGREVALKVPRRVTSSLRELFMNEARLLAQVRHEHVVALHAFGTAGDRVYFTMDLIQGWDGAKLIKRARRTRAHRRRGSVLLRALRLSEESMAPDLKAAIGRRRPYYRLVALWIAQAAEGLAAAHEHGILHRDIKPANLLVGGDGRMLLADFGLASPLCKLAQGAAGEPTGTRPYIAPERLVGDTASVDHRSDIWSLGATLYEFLSFRRAFEGGGDDVLSAIATREPTALRAFQRSVPRELERICSRAMRRDPQHRYETASKMADELRRWVERPPARLGRWSIAAVLIASAALAAPRAWPAYWLSSNVRDVGMQQAEVSRKSEAAGSREMRISRGDGLEDRAAHSRPREAAPAAIATPSERLPQPLPSSGVVTQNGSVLLAVNYDLNADDDCPPRTGGTPEAAFRRVCARENVKLAEPIEVPKTWSFPEAMTAAGRCGATVVAFCEINAVPLGQTPRIQGLDFETTRWRLWAELTICRVADGQICRPSPVVLESNPTRPATEHQFGGEELILLSARAAQEALKEARRLATP